MRLPTRLVVAALTTLVLVAAAPAVATPETEDLVQEDAATTSTDTAESDPPAPGTVDGDASSTDLMPDSSTDPTPAPDPDGPTDVVPPADLVEEATVNPPIEPEVAGEVAFPVEAPCEEATLALVDEPEVFADYVRAEYTGQACDPDARTWVSFVDAATGVEVNPRTAYCCRLSTAPMMTALGGPPAQWSLRLAHWSSEDSDVPMAVTAPFTVQTEGPQPFVIRTETSYSQRYGTEIYVVVRAERSRTGAGWAPVVPTDVTVLHDGVEIASRRVGFGAYIALPDQVREGDLLHVSVAGSRQVLPTEVTVPLDTGRAPTVLTITSVEPHPGRKTGIVVTGTATTAAGPGFLGLDLRLPGSDGYVSPTTIAVRENPDGTVTRTWSLSEHQVPQRRTTVTVRYIGDELRLPASATGSGGRYPDRVQLVLSPDFGHKGYYPALVAVDASGRLHVNIVNKAGIGASYVQGGGWADLTVHAPGDWDGDARGYTDLLATDRAGRLYLYSGLSEGFRAARQVGRGWSSYRIVPFGDQNGDGHVDLLAVDSTGRLWFYPNDGRGGFGRRGQIGHGWSRVTLYPAGDMNGDGRPDALGVDRTGTMYWYPGQGNGRLGAAVRVGSGWQGYLIAAGQSIDGDGVGDIIARDRAGRVWYYPGKGSGRFGKRTLFADEW